MQIIQYKKAQTNTASPEKREELVRKMRKEHEKLVKGMFEFVDAQGGWLDFSYRWFKDDLLSTYKLTHGEICELPMGIVKHLNNTYKKVRTTTGQMGPDGKPIMTLTKTSRVRFTPVEMM